MRRVGPALGFSVTIAVSSCSGGGETSAREYAVSGVMQMVGGRPGTEPIPAPGTVTARASGSAVTATVETDDDGNYEMQLPSGRYTITGRSERYNRGDIDCNASQAIVVDDLDVSDVEVQCQMR